MQDAETGAGSGAGAGGGKVHKSTMIPNNLLEADPLVPNSMQLRKGMLESDPKFSHSQHNISMLIKN